MQLTKTDYITNSIISETSTAALHRLEM